MSEPTPAARRDLKRWPYAMRLRATDGVLLIETVHKTLSSLRTEVEVSAARITRAEPDWGGHVPGSIEVEGLAEDEWRPWAQR